MTADTQDRAERQIEVTPDDLPLHCPMTGQTQWSAHPRVFLPIEATGVAQCPYCGTVYRLKGGARPGSH
ncbi:MAG: zinc-finger domain-containing protein [Betaproteobacteria bacterium]|nr:zinc-finger domain-containing protein [Betaproteobacteria bacterium]